MEAAKEDVAVMDIEPRVRSDARFFEQDVDGDDVPEGELVRGRKNFGRCGRLDDFGEQRDRDRRDKVRGFYTLLAVIARNAHSPHAVSLAMAPLDAVAKPNLVSKPGDRVSHAFRKT